MKELILTPTELAHHLLEKSFHFDVNEDSLVMSTTIYTRHDLIQEIQSKFQPVHYKLTRNLDVNKLSIDFKMP